MAAPPFAKKAAKRRLDQALPSKSAPTKKGGVATFKNPGNKAGKNLMQQGSGEGINPEKDVQASGLMAMLAGAASKKQKTKVQPAASRKVMAMRMAAKK